MLDIVLFVFAFSVLTVFATSLCLKRNANSVPVKNTTPAIDNQIAHIDTNLNPGYAKVKIGHGTNLQRLPSPGSSVPVGVAQKSSRYTEPPEQCFNIAPSVDTSSHNMFIAAAGSVVPQELDYDYVLANTTTRCYDESIEHAACTKENTESRNEFEYDYALCGARRLDVQLAKSHSYTTLLYSNNGVSVVSAHAAQISTKSRCYSAEYIDKCWLIEAKPEANQQSMRLKAGTAIVSFGKKSIQMQQFKLYKQKTSSSGMNFFSLV